MRAAPAAAGTIFGAHLDGAVRYAELLGTAGVERGLIGPREVDRLWERHLLNCAVIGELIGPALRVVDVGSGAGLPGIALALARPDLHVTLVEPLARRCDFLREALDLLELRHVRVLRGRAEEPATAALVGEADVVTARAVSALDMLATWCLPLLRRTGHLLAIKGATAAAEVTRTGAALRRLGAGSVTVVSCGVGIVDPATTVVDVVRASRRGSR